MVVVLGLGVSLGRVGGGVFGRGGSGQVKAMGDVRCVSAGGRLSDRFTSGPSAGGS